MRYFVSDFHFGHYYNGRGIITFERTQFNTIEEHDLHIEAMIRTLCRKLKPGDEVWNLGDFGCLNNLYTVDWIKRLEQKPIFFMEIMIGKVIFLNLSIILIKYFYIQFIYLKNLLLATIQWEYFQILLTFMVIYMEQNSFPLTI